MPSYKQSYIPGDCIYQRDGTKGLSHRNVEILSCTLPLVVHFSLAGAPPKVQILFMHIQNLLEEHNNIVVTGADLGGGGGSGVATPQCDFDVWNMQSGYYYSHVTETSYYFTLLAITLRVFRSMRISTSSTGSPFSLKTGYYPTCACAAGVK